MNQRRIELSASADHAEPELVLVLEVATSIPDFMAAVRRVQGLEWLAEVGDIDQEEDGDFGPLVAGKAFRGEMYLLLTDATALANLLSLWGRWKRGQPMPHGFAKFRDVFAHLRVIRRWDSRDRVRETGLQERVEGLLPNQSLTFEVELWFRADELAARRARRHVEDAVTEAGGQVITHSRLEDILYEGVLVDLPAGKALELVNDQPAIRLALLDDVMYLRPLPQGIAGRDPAAGPPADAVPDAPDPTLPPTVALLDGVPQTNHPDLAGRLQIDDPEDYESEYMADERHHGTAMASLITRGDISGDETPLGRRVLVRPIMVPDQASGIGPRPERFPAGRLPLDVLHQALIDVAGPDRQGRRVHPAIRIANLSIGDPARVYAQAMSPLARLLDWAASQFNLLIVVSAGNDQTPFTLDCTNAELAQLDEAGLQDLTVQAIHRDARLRRVYAPAEAMNALTVGAAPDDAATPPAIDPRRNPISEPSLAAPYSRLGGGHRRSIKPDVLREGGRLRYRVMPGPANSHATLQPMPSPAAGPGQLVAAPGAPTRPDRLYAQGTSNAAALVTRHAATMLEVLEGMAERPAWLTEPVMVQLLRALVVHGARWGPALRVVEHALGSPTLAKRFLERSIGHGRLLPGRLTTLDQSRVVLLAGGEIVPGSADQHTIPLPASLASIHGERRLITTLSWMPPCNSRHQRYRGIALKLDDGSAKPLVNMTSEGADHSTTQRGTLEHHVKRSVGTAVFPPGAGLTLRVDCATDAISTTDPVPYGLVVTLEVAPALGIDVYTEVLAQVRQRAAVRVTA